MSYSRHPGDAWVLEHDTTEAVAKLLARTVEDEGCLLWQGGLSKSGVPAIGVRVGGISFRVQVPAFLWIVHHGEERGGDDVRRTCGNLRCVAVRHLTLAVPGTTVSDATRERKRRATRRLKRKLTRRQVAEIRRRRAAGEPLAGLAEEFGVCSAAVYHVATGRCFTDEGEPGIRICTACGERGHSWPSCPARSAA